MCLWVMRETRVYEKITPVDLGQLDCRLKFVKPSFADLECCETYPFQTCGIAAFEKWQVGTTLAYQQLSRLFLGLSRK